MCDCHSYNGAFGSVPEAYLDIAQYFPWMQFTRPKVSIDACIAKDVEKLWQMGIHTRGSCCGHGDASLGPNVVIEGENDAFLAKLFLPDFQILCWKLTDVGEYK